MPAPTSITWPMSRLLRGSRFAFAGSRTPTAAALDRCPGAEVSHLCMVFTPNGGGPLEPPSQDEVLDAQLTAKAARGRSVVHPSAPTDRRIVWRAVVRSPDRNTVFTEWHLAACTEPSNADAHCPEGRRLIATTGEPAGHCVVSGQCLICEAAARDN